MTKYFENMDIEALQARLEALHREFGTQAGALEAERLLHDLAVHQVELEMQNAELRASQQALAESRDRYANLYDFAPIGYLTLDKKGRMVELNLTAARMLGTERGRLAGRPFSVYLSADDTGRFYAHLRQAFESDTKVIVELALKGRDGTISQVWLESLGVRGAGSAVCRTAMLDITDRKRAEEELARNREHLEALVQQRTADLQRANLRLRSMGKHLSRAQRIAGLGSWENDLLQHRGRWSNEAFRIFGYAPRSFNPSFDRFLELVHPEDRPRIEKAVKAAGPGCEDVNVEFRIVRPDGEERLLHSVGEAVLTDDGRAARVIGTVRDITDQRRAEERLRQAAAVFERSHEGILILDAGGCIAGINPAFARVTGYSPPDVIGQELRMLRSERHDAAFYGELWKKLESQGHWEGELWVRRHDGESLATWFGITAVRDDAGRVVSYVAILADIGPLKEVQQQLSLLAHHDGLTGLANRLLLTSNLEHALQRAGRYHHRVAVLWLDLDRFKAVNDTLGHDVGDRALQRTAERLRNSVRAEDTVARLGGDEFVIVLEDVTLAEDAALLTQKIIETVAQPINVDGHTILFSTSVGISVYPDDASGVDDLLRMADMALYRAKQSGRGTYSFYTRELTDRSLKLTSLERQLRKALEHEQFVLYYQPQISLSRGRVIGLEALLRWRHPDRGLLPAEAFIAVAEESRLVVPIGAWVLHSALAAVRAWQSAGLQGVCVAINVSGLQLTRGQIVRQLHSALEGLGGQPGELPFELEITESALLALEDSVDTVKDMRSLGVKLAIDDFGTGYSSLSRLKRLPVDTLKIDRSFVEGLPGSPHNETIAASIIALGQSLGLNVIAEGVQSRGQLEFLRAHGCDLIQGFLCGEALPEEQIAEVWKRPPLCIGAPG